MINNLSKYLFDNQNNCQIIYDRENQQFISSKKKFKKKNEIFDFFEDEQNSNLITYAQKKFYEEIKFPNYDGLESYNDLIDKAGKTNHFADILDNSIDYNSSVLEVGCGTGQLSLFLKRFNRKLVGIDLSIPSLELANKFKIRNEIENVTFLKMNIFNLYFKEGVFDYVISNGVLHHTYDTEKAFKNILFPLKKNGYIVIGLYHKFGRLFTNLKQLIIQNFGEKFKFLDPRNIDKNISQEKRYAWLKDQYKNPHETSHTLDEVLLWFKKYNVEFISSIPFNSFSSNSNIFEKKGNIRNLFIKEISMAFSLSQIKEGGFFIIIGKKN